MCNIEWLLAINHMKLVLHSQINFLLPYWMGLVNAVQLFVLVIPASDRAERLVDWC